MAAVMNEELAVLARAWSSAPHGQRGTIIQEASVRLRVSRATLHRHMKKFTVAPERKQRSDAGTVTLTRDEALAISATILEAMRKHGKQILSVGSAVAMLRANGWVQAQRTNPVTGEVTDLSDSAILRGLRAYNLHPEQLRAAPPAVAMRSLHPNHVWQIDASRCVLYYLPQTAGDNGLRVAHADEFYKNKPANLIKGIKYALWRYVITDHRSGWVYACYVLDGETTMNLAEAFIDAMVQRPGEALYGVPKMAMLDPGSSNRSSAFRNLCKALQVVLQINRQGNPRAKGQVEQGQNLVETDFESKLRFVPLEKVDSLEKINALVARWRKSFNATREHTRHGMTRDQAWLHIKPEELIVPPSVEVLRGLVLSAPQTRVVDDFLRVSLGGENYDASQVPGVNVGDKLQLCQNPWQADSVHAVLIDAEGRTVYQVLPQVALDDFGQPVDAPVFGERFASHADTPVQRNLKELEMLATGAATLEEAHAKRRGKARDAYTPFDGKLDPFADITNTPIPAFVPRAGTDHDLVAPAVALPKLTHIQAAKALREMVPDWSRAQYAWLLRNHPDGVAQEEIEAIAAELISQTGHASPNVVPLAEHARRARSA